MAEEHEDIIIRDSNKSKYNIPWVVEYIVEERNKEKTWDEIADGLKERGVENITGQVCSTLHKKALAKTLTTSTQAKEEFIEFTQELKNIYGDVIKLMGNYVKSLRTINDELDKIKVVDEEGNVDLLKTQMAIAKQIPLATGLMKEVREYVKNQIALYDIIQETKEKEVVFSTSQILEKIDEYFPSIVEAKIEKLRSEYGDTIPIKQLEKEIKLGFK